MIKPELLITVHGIQSNGRWHDLIAAQLEPHFECKKVRYHGYRWFGPVAFAAVPLGVIVLCPASFVVALAYLRPDLVSLSTTPFVVSIVASLVLILVGTFLPQITLYSVRRQILKYGAAGLTDPPHLIAHSFGTFLSCWALYDYTVMRFSRMILVGCILPVAFPWRQLLAQKPKAMLSVRHEVGMRDWVVRAAWLVRLVNNRVGPAGVGGFTLDAGLVHEGNAWIACGECACGTPARVHNYRQNSPHWISIFEEGEPRTIWLPYLWGYEPNEWDCYQRLCRRGLTASRAGYDSEAGRIERNFRWHTWTWTRGMTCEQYLALVIRDHYISKKLLPPTGEDMEAMQKAAIHWIWRMNEAAHSEWQKTAARDDQIVMRMRPQWLFEEAVLKALPEGIAA